MRQKGGIKRQPRDSRREGRSDIPGLPLGMYHGRMNWEGVNQNDRIPGMQQGKHVKLFWPTFIFKAGGGLLKPLGSQQRGPKFLWTSLEYLPWEMLTYNQVAHGTMLRKKGPSFNCNEHQGSAYARSLSHSIYSIYNIAACCVCVWGGGGALSSGCYKFLQDPSCLWTTFDQWIKTFLHFKTHVHHSIRQTNKNI